MVMFYPGNLKKESRGLPQKVFILLRIEDVFGILSCMAARRIGTSGWYYDHWAHGVFYPAGLSKRRWLEYYASVFNAVELNVTFYRPVQGTTFRAWKEATPPGFRFVAKGPRLITHVRRIKAIEEPLERFFESAKELKEKLSAVLWQFPPGFKKEKSLLALFLKRLKKTGAKQVFEFRHESWFDPEIFSLLSDFNGCLCIAHSPKRKPVLKITSDFLYLRFHGGEVLYGSDYSDRELKEWAAFVRRSAKKELFAFFNNDAHGYAVRNALTFKQFIK